MDDVVVLIADLKVTLIPARRQAPQPEVPPWTRTHTVFNDESWFSDPAENAEVDLFGSESVQHDDVPQRSYLSHAQLFLEPPWWKN